MVHWSHTHQAMALLAPLSPEGCLYALRPQSLKYREVDTTSSWCHDPTVTQLTWREAGQITHRVQLKHVELVLNKL